MAHMDDGSDTALSVKNTFLELVSKGPTSPSGSGRSPSTPASWRPGNAKPEGEQADGCVSDDSATTASQTRSKTCEALTPSTPSTDLWPDTDSDEEKFTGPMTVRGRAETMPSPALAWQPAPPSAEALAPGSSATPLNRQAPAFMSAYSLPSCETPQQWERGGVLEAAQAHAPGSSATPLNRHAPALMPASALPSNDTPQQWDLTGILEALKAVFMKMQDAADVQVHKHGQSITVHAIFKNQQSAERLHQAREAMKKTILDTSADSENTYVLGYCAHPFKDHGWDGGPCHLGFVTTLSYLPPSRASSACWDTYQRGFCPRRAQCWWSHPTDVDTHRVRVSLGVADQSPSTQAALPETCTSLGEVHALWQ